MKFHVTGKVMCLLALTLFVPQDLWARERVDAASEQVLRAHGQEFRRLFNFDRGQIYQDLSFSSCVIGNRQNIESTKDRIVAKHGRLSEVTVCVAEVADTDMRNAVTLGRTDFTTARLAISKSPLSERDHVIAIDSDYPLEQVGACVRVDLSQHSIRSVQFGHGHFICDSPGLGEDTCFLPLKWRWHLNRNDIRFVACDAKTMP
ncbi:MAG: hypothetical protein JNJ49_09440 [Bdellovibrionaceae bacterium]|nr:hypothetical protein [Pseudobdellovibrionaceae bacterium]